MMDGVAKEKVGELLSRIVLPCTALNREVKSQEGAVAKFSASDGRMGGSFGAVRRVGRPFPELEHRR